MRLDSPCGLSPSSRLSRNNHRNYKVLERFYFKKTLLTHCWRQILLPPGHCWHLSCPFLDTQGVKYITKLSSLHSHWPFIHLHPAAISLICVSPYACPYESDWLFSSSPLLYSPKTPTSSIITSGLGGFDYTAFYPLLFVFVYLNWTFN